MATQISDATNLTTDLSFGIRVPSNNPINPSRQPFVLNNRIRPAIVGGSQGAAAIALSSIACMNPMIVLNTNPTAGNAPDVYVLPSATALLAEFGRNLDTGLSKAASGDILRIQFVNAGQVDAQIRATGAQPGNPNWGGDGTTVTVPRAANPIVNGLASTGVIGNGNVSNVYIRFTNVSSGLGGTTGSYTIFPSVY